MSPSLHQLRHEYEKQITSLKQNIMLPNFLVLLATAFIPFIVAMGYYHSSVFGGDNWQKIAGLTDEQHAKPVKTSKLLLSLVLNFFLAFGLYNVCVHQAGLFGMIGANTDLLTSGVGKAFFDEYGMNHLSFGHGVLHGLAPGTLTFALPIVGYVVIFEKKSRAYFFVTLGYWAICMALMGGVISQWGWVLP